MSHTVSPSSNKPYGVARVVGIWGLARSSFYAARRQGQQRREARKRGPRVASDEELITEIRRLLDAPVFAGEGYRKIWARLRHKGVRKGRVLRLLRAMDIPNDSSIPGRHWVKFPIIAACQTTGHL